jgi:putative effector of murein hydrolase LrgA (UPF0299 family)
MTLLFLPTGVWTIKGAFAIKEAPHVFVMLVFSASLMILVGLVGLVGLIARGRTASMEDHEFDPEKPVAPGGGDT